MRRLQEHLGIFVVAVRNGKAEEIPTKDSTGGSQ
jgi:hypothetical protein